MHLKHWQAGDIDHLSRKTVPVFDQPLGKEMCSNIEFEPPLKLLLTERFGPEVSNGGDTSKGFQGE